MGADRDADKTATVKLDATVTASQDTPQALSDSELDHVSAGYTAVVDKPDPGIKPRSVHIIPG